MIDLLVIVMLIVYLLTPGEYEHIVAGVVTASVIVVGIATLALRI